MTLYETEPAGLAPSSYDLGAWWPGTILLIVEIQMARLKFDLDRMEISGAAGISRRQLRDGTYMLALVVSEGEPQGGLRIVSVIPMAGIWLADGRAAYTLHSGIVALDP